MFEPPTLPYMQYEKGREPNYVNCTIWICFSYIKIQLHSSFYPKRPVYQKSKTCKRGENINIKAN